MQSERVCGLWKPPSRPIVLNRVVEMEIAGPPNHILWMWPYAIRFYMPWQIFISEIRDTQKNSVAEKYDTKEPVTSLIVDKIFK